MATGGSDASLGSMTDKRENLTCALCLEIFRNPKRLTCSHTYCEKCLDDLIQKAPYSSTFPCPSCRRDVQVPTGGASAFQANFYIDPEDLERARDRTRCTIHPQKKYDLFCVECDALICMDCKLNEHLHHASKTLDDAAKLAPDQLTEDRVRLEKATADLEKNASFRETDQTELQKKKEVVEQEIRQRHSTIMAAIDQYRDEALADLEASFAEKANARTEDLDVIKKNKQELQRMMGKIDRAKQQDQKQEIVIVAKEMRSGDGSPKAVEKLRSVPHLTQVSRPVHRSVVPKDDAMFNDIKTFIGKTEYLDFNACEPEVKIATQFQCEKEEDIVTPFFVCPMLEDTVYVSFDPSYKQNAPKAKRFGINGKMLYVLSNADRVEAVGRVSMIRDNCVVFYDDNGETKCSKMKTSVQQYSSRVCGISATAIQVISDKKTERFIVGCGSHRAFDVDSTETRFAVVTEPNDVANRVIKLFKYTRHLGNRGGNHSTKAVGYYLSPVTPFRPADVCFFTLQGKEMLLIADEHNDAIHVVDVQDDQLTFSRFLSPGNPHLLQPTALNIDHKGRLWVACRGARMVVFEALTAAAGEESSD